MGFNKVENIFAKKDYIIIKFFIPQNLVAILRRIKAINPFSYS